MAEQQENTLYVPDGGDGAAAPAAEPSPVATSSTDSDRGNEVGLGKQLISEGEIATEVARRDAPAPATPPAEPPHVQHNQDQGLQKVQQDVALSQRQQAAIGERLDTLQETLVQFLSNQQQLAAEPETPTAAPPTPQVAAGELVQQAFNGVDMLDAEAVQGAMTTMVGRLQSSMPAPDNSGLQDVFSAVTQLGQRVDQIGTQVQQNQTATYNSQTQVRYGVNDEQYQAAMTQATKTVTDMGLFAAGSEAFQGAVHTQHHMIMAAMPKGQTPAPPNGVPNGTQGNVAQPPAPTVPGTIVQPGASANTGPPPENPAFVETVRDEDLWTPDAP